MTPAIVVVHHATLAGAAVRLVRLWDDRNLLVLDADITDQRQALEEMAGRITGQSVIRVVHLVDADRVGVDTLTGRLDELKGIDAEIPGFDFQHFAVVRVGLDLVPEHAAVIALAEQAELSGVLIVTRSTQAIAALDPRDELGIVADASFVLARCAFGNAWELSKVWAVGASAVVYSQRGMAASIAAWEILRLLDDTLLAPLRAASAACERGRAMVGELVLGDDESRAAMLVAGSGGSVLSWLRPRSREFEGLDLEVLPDALRTHADDLMLRALARARRQIEGQAQRQLHEARQRVRSNVADYLTESLSLAETESFVDCAGDAAMARRNRARADAAQARESLDSPEEVLGELERRIRKLPYPAAIVTRSMAAGALAAILVSSLIPAAWPALVVAGGGGAASTSALFLTVYAVQYRAIIRLREIFLNRLSQHLEDLAQVHLLEQVSRGWAELVQLLTVSIPAELQQLRRDVDELREVVAAQVVSRQADPLDGTALRVSVPTPEDMTTESLAQRFPLRDLALLRNQLSAWLVAGEARDAAPALVDRLTDLALVDLSGRLWPDLSAVMRDMPEEAARARAILQLNVLPLAQARVLAGHDNLTRRAFAMEAALHEFLDRGADPVGGAQLPVGARLDTASPDVAIRLDLVNLAPLAPAAAPDLNARP